MSHNTIIRDDNRRLIAVSRYGFLVDDKGREVNISTLLTPEQRKAMADALDPGRGPRIAANVTETDAALRSELMGAYGQRDRLRVLLDEAKDERDAAVARAKEAERELAGSRDAHQRSADAHMEWKARAEVAEQEHEYARKRLREVCSTPAVSRADVEKALLAQHRMAFGVPIVSVEEATETLHTLMSGADPVVYVVRESELDAVKVERDSHGELFADGEHVYANGAADARNLAGGYIQKAVRRFAVARAIEAEAAAPDPVEELAAQIEDATRKAVRQVCDELTSVTTGLDPRVVVEMLDITEQSRRLARHVLAEGGGRDDR